MRTNQVIHRGISPHRPSAALPGLLLAAALSGGALAPPAASAGGAADWPVERILGMAAITHTAPSPDGSQVAYVVSRADLAAGTVRRELFVADVDGAGSRALTAGQGPVEAPAWSPDGRWIGYLQRPPASNTDPSAEDAELMMIQPDGGEPRRLSDQGTVVAAFRWAPKGDAVAFLRVKRPAPAGEAIVAGADPVRRQLWWRRIDRHGVAAPSRPLTPESLHVGSGLLEGTPFDWSPDGREIAFTHTRGPAPDGWKSADISVVTVASGQIRPFQQSNAAEFAPAFSPDGRHIAFSITMFPPSAVWQWRIGLARADGSRLRLLAGTPDEQPRIVGWISNRMLLVHEPDRTVTALWKLPANGGRPTRFDDGARVLSALALNATASRLTFAAMNDQLPQEAAVTPLRSFRPAAVTALDAAAGPVPGTRAVTWKGADGRTVEGLLTLPAGHHQGSRPALLVQLHDEPGGAFTRDYPGHPGGVFPLATLAERGYAVLRANVRGAGGYGHGFRADPRGGWGGADYQDLMAGVDHLIAEGLADPDRVALLGWGHGGFLAALAVTRTHRFAAAVLGAPMTDLVHVRATSAAGGFVADYLEGEFWEREDAYRSRSPLLQAHRITTPVLILHGEADRRVPAAQSLALRDALLRQGLEHRLVLYPGASHHLTAPGQRLHAMREVLAWLDAHVPAQR